MADRTTVRNQRMAEVVNSAVKADNAARAKAARNRAHDGRVAFLRELGELLDKEWWSTVIRRVVSEGPSLVARVA